MLTPSNRTITIASGGTALVGRTTAIGGSGGGGGGATPAWLVAHDAAVGLNTWRAIPGTAGAGGADVNEFSGFAEKNGMLISAAAGGHHKYDNRVTSLDLMQNVPGWILRSAPTPYSLVIPDAAYNNDPSVDAPSGKPNSGHNRCELWWSARFNRVVRIGARDLYSELSVGSKPAVSSFNLDTNQWDAAGFFPDIPANGATPGSAYVIGGAFIGVDDSFNCFSGRLRMNADTKTWDALTTPSTPIIKAPWATAPELNLVFGLAIGDGWGSGSTVSAVRLQNGVQTSITINASAALTDFIAKAPSEAAMHFDPPNNRFVFSDGSTLWSIVPNGTNTWDMVAFTYGVGSATLPATIAAIENRFIYSRALKGFLTMPDAASNVYFMRTSA